MKIHEYQAKELLAAAGAVIPRGIVASNVAEVLAAFDQIGAPVVLKAQIHAGGRGKGYFKGSGTHVGGVKFIKSRDECARVADIYFKYPLITKQTGEQGQKVSRVLVQEAADIAREIYVGIVLDRSTGMPILMACAEGGVEIEEVAAKTPEKILKAAIHPELGLLPLQTRQMVYDLPFVGDQIAKAAKIMMALSKVFLEKDCSLAEINPLAVSPKGEVLVLDAKITFDDNALFRHPEIEQMRDENEENPAELRAMHAGITYISLNGNIGCLVNGAGLAMSTMDIIKYHGGEPANFLDVGGGAKQDQRSEEHT